MQNSLFDAPDDPDKAPASAPAAPRKRAPPVKVRPAPADPALQDLARELPAGLHLGTSSWNYPGWNGMV
jgi:hypothetical protein